VTLWPPRHVLSKKYSHWLDDTGDNYLDARRGEASPAESCQRQRTPRPTNRTPQRTIIFA
jgi:hypothetical protein